MPTFQSDGPLPTGSYELTFNEISNETYVADNFQWGEDSSTDVSRMLATGGPKGSKVVKGFRNGSCDLQLADDDATEPDINDTFVIGNKGYFITSRGQTRNVNDEYKFNANIRMCVNPLITTPAADVPLTQSVAMTDINSAATGPEASMTYTWSATNLPTNVAINTSTGVISGTPSAVETVTATIKATATDSGGVERIGVRKIKFTVTA